MDIHSSFCAKILIFILHSKGVVDLMKTKKLTAVLAVCAMSAFAFAAAVHAEGEVAQIDDQKYTTLQAAVEAAKTGDTIEMIDNATVTANIDIPSGITLTLDMNGNTITTDPVN